MNTRITLSAALAATALFAFTPAQAQAPGTSSALQTLRLETKIDAMQQQISALQAQVQQLQAQLRAKSAAPAIVFPAPLTLPGLNGLGSPQTLVVPLPRSRNGSIPDYTATFIHQTAR